MMGVVWSEPGYSDSTHGRSYLGSVSILRRIEIIIIHDAFRAETLKNLSSWNRGLALYKQNARLEVPSPHFWVGTTCMCKTLDLDVILQVLFYLDRE